MDPKSWKHCSRKAPISNLLPSIFNLLPSLSRKRGPERTGHSAFQSCIHLLALTFVSSSESYVPNMSALKFAGQEESESYSSPSSSSEKREEDPAAQKEGDLGLPMPYFVEARARLFVSSSGVRVHPPAIGASQTTKVRPKYFRTLVLYKDRCEESKLTKTTAEGTNERGGGRGERK